jgi:hypothetical protein
MTYQLRSESIDGLLLALDSENNKPGNAGE